MSDKSHSLRSGRYRGNRHRCGGTPADGVKIYLQKMSLTAVSGGGTSVWMSVDETSVMHCRDAIKLRTLKLTYKRPDRNKH